MTQRKINIDELRERALRALQAAEQGAPRDSGAAEDSGTYRLVEELRIYHTELEIQNQELVSSQEALERARTKYQALFAGMPIPVLLCDSQGFIVELNQAALRLLELRHSRVDQRHSFLPHVDLFNRAWVQSMLMQPAEPGRLSTRQIGIALPGGAQIPSELRIQRVAPGDDGQTLHLIMLIDKTLEVEYAQQSVDLAREKETAEAANQAKSLFLANMSHELRTPLSGMLGLTHILRNMTHDAQHIDKLDKINTAGKHLTQLIDDILDLARIESGKLVLEHVVFSLGEIVSAAVTLVEPKALSKHLRILVDIEPAVPLRLHGDPLRLRQALVNYLGNAIKFTDSGEIWLHVRVERRHYNEALLRFEVQDNGPGIAQDVLPRLFTPFMQGDSSHTRRHGGTGLGLAITKQLALLMQGDVGVSSTPGAGATFWFTGLFLCEPSADAAALEATIDPNLPLKSLKADYAGCALLLCEDDPVNAEIIDYLVTEAGLVLDKAADGRIGVDKARDFAYDLILMDMQMPHMNGIEATLAIRCLPGYAERPIIALTANAFSADRDACLAAGMDDFLAKPVDQFQFYAVLLAHLRKVRAA